MTTPHQFCVRDVELNLEQIQLHREIADAHGVTFHYQGRQPGTPMTGWFELEHFDALSTTLTAASVRRALREAGLLEAVSPTCKRCDSVSVEEDPLVTGVFEPDAGFRVTHWAPLPEVSE